MMNLGGGIPGVSDMSTFGSPSKFTYCVRENEEQSPWAPMPGDFGFGKDENVLTVCNAEAPRMAMDDVSAAPEGVLTTLSHTMCAMGATTAYTQTSWVVVVAPDHADILARGGLSRADVKRELFERARMPVGILKKGGRYRGANSRAGRSGWITTTMIPSPRWCTNPKTSCSSSRAASPARPASSYPAGTPRARPSRKPYRTD